MRGEFGRGIRPHSELRGTTRQLISVSFPGYYLEKKLLFSKILEKILLIIIRIDLKIRKNILEEINKIDNILESWHVLNYVEDPLDKEEIKRLSYRRKKPLFKFLEKYLLDNKFFY